MVDYFTISSRVNSSSRDGQFGAICEEYAKQALSFTTDGTDAAGLGYRLHQFEARTTHARRLRQPLVWNGRALRDDRDVRVVSSLFRLDTRIGDSSVQRVDQSLEFRRHRRGEQAGNLRSRPELETIKAQPKRLDANLRGRSASSGTRCSGNSPI